MSIKPLVGSGEIVERVASTESALDMSWLDGRVRLDHRHWQSAETDVVWTAPQHLLVLTDSGRTARTLMRVNGKVVYDGADYAGALTFVPAGTERRNVYRDAHLSYTALWIDPSFGNSALPDGIGIIANARDEVLRVLIASLRDELLAGWGPSAVYVEHLTALVLDRLAAVGGRAASPPPPARHAALSRPASERVRDYVRAHVGMELSIKDMAAVAGLAPDSFARRFKATTGMSPYAFVLEERVRQAEALLAETREPIGGIAMQLGFANQSHLTSTFRRQRGITPLAFRANFVPRT